MQAVPESPPAAAWWSGIALCLAAALLAIWWPPYTPGQDTPHHLFFAQVLAMPEHFAADYEVVFAPTSQGFVYLASLLVPAFGLVAAGKLVRTLGLLLLFWGYWRLGRAAGATRPPGALLGLAASASFYHAMGFENFALAIPLGLLALAFTLEAGRTGRWRTWAAAGAVLLLCSVAHSVVAGMIGLELALAAFLVAPAGKRMRRLLQLGAIAAPAAAHALFGVWLSAKSQAERGLAEGLGVQRLDAGEQILNIVEQSLGGFSLFGYLVLLSALVLAASSRVRHPGWTPVRRLAAATLALWAVIYFVTPFHGAGWAYAQPRVLVPLVLVPLGLLGWGRMPRAELALIALAVAVFLVDSAAQGRHAGEAVAAQVARFGPGPAGRSLAITIDPGSSPTARHVRPLLHAATYILARGGFLPHVEAANPAIHAVISRHSEADLPSFPPPFAHRSLDCSFNRNCEVAALVLAQRIAVEGLAWENVMLVGGPEAFRDDLVGRGYERLAPDRFAPRPAWLDVTLVSAELDVRGLAVRAGYPGELGWFSGAFWPGRATDGAEQVAVGPLPAGLVHIDCRWVVGTMRVTELDRAPPACSTQAVLSPGERTRIVLELQP